VRTSTIVMIGFAVLFGLLAVFLAQTWLNNQADQRMRSLDAQRKNLPPAHTIVVATKPLRFGNELTSMSMREVAWPEEALPAGAFASVAELASSKRVVLTPIEPNEAILATKITGPGQRATLSAVLKDGMKAVTIRVNDVEGVAGFVLPGDRVDVTLTRQGDKQGEKTTAMNDVVIQNVRVLGIDQFADERSDKPAVVKAVTLEVDVTDGQKLALASAVGTLGLLLRKSGEVVLTPTRRVTLTDLSGAGVPTGDSKFATIVVTRASTPREYSVPVEGNSTRAVASSERVTAGH
jgi:pilus assembly protein CpaB